MKSIKKFILPATLASLPAMTAEVNTVFEAAFESSKVHANPFVDVEVDVRFSKDGREWRVPAFRGGGMTWKVRSAAPEEAVYHYRAVANDSSDPGLNFTGRMFTATAYSGGNPL